MAPLIAFLVPLCLLASPLMAQEAQPPLRDVVRFEAQASREVANDELVAVLAVELHGPDPAALARTVNRRMAEALKAAAASPSVKARSGNYQSFPRFGENRRVQEWQVSQELRLESRDFAAVTELIGRLQENLVVRSMTVRVSREARRAAEDALISEAIAAFHDRAERVRKAMQASGYRVREIALSSGAEAPPRPFEMRAMAQEAVAVQPGVSLVTVTATGSIQLR